MLVKEPTMKCKHAMVKELNITSKNLFLFLYDMKLKKRENICSCKAAIGDTQKCNSFYLVSNYIQNLRGSVKKATDIL